MPEWLQVCAGVGASLAAFGAIFWAVFRWVMNLGRFLDDIRETRSTIAKNSAISSDNSDALREATHEIRSLRLMLQDHERRLERLERSGRSGADWTYRE